ncbi:MAG: TIGR02206 family membrane protein [Terracidiphilus sp.]
MMQGVAPIRNCDPAVSRCRAAVQPPALPLLGTAHLFILGGVLLLAALLAWMQRKLPPGSKGIRVILAAVLLADTALWYGYLAGSGQLVFPRNLPLELCDVTLLLMLAALLTLRPAIFDLAYYGALAGTSMALLTPDLWESFPSWPTVQFFVAHGLVVTAALYLVWSGQARPRPGSVARAMLAANLYAAMVGAFDWIFKTNYMYLRSKPGKPSLLDFFGPWPWYLVTAEGAALGLFLFLYLPFRYKRRKEIR